MAQKEIDWSNIGFGYIKTDYRYVSNFKDGSWDEGTLTTDDMITLNECACVFQYAQTCFEGLKAYTTEDGHIVTFRPDLNAERMMNSAARLEMPQFPKERKFLIENGAILSRPMQNLQIVPWKDLNRLGIIGQKRRRVPSIIPRHFPPGLTPVTVFIPLLQSQHIRLTKMNRKSVRHRHHGPVMFTGTGCMTAAAPTVPAIVL